jgi:uncharacterized membrane protein
MAFCSSCGEQMKDGMKFCSSCGAQMDNDAQQHKQQRHAYQEPVTPGAATKADIRDAQDNKTMSILAYILFFVPLMTGAHKTSAFAKYHTNQGTVLFIFSLALGVVYGILTSLLATILFSGGWGLFSVVMTILGVFWLIPAGLCVVGIINASQGKMKPLPIIGGFTIIK